MASTFAVPQFWQVEGRQETVRQLLLGITQGCEGFLVILQQFSMKVVWELLGVVSTINASAGIDHCLGVSISFPNISVTPAPAVALR